MDFFNTAIFTRVKKNEINRGENLIHEWMRIIENNTKVEDITSQRIAASVNFTPTQKQYYDVYTKNDKNRHKKYYYYFLICQLVVFTPQATTILYR
jgi:hypothetical protein